MDARLHLAVCRFARLVNTTSLRIKKPTVVTAAQAALLDAPKLERCAAVRAMALEQAKSPGSIAEQDQILAK
jgi:hypothetical protein